MKIRIAQVPPEGLLLEEEIQAKDLDLGLENVTFLKPLQVSAQVSKITNAVTVDLSLDTSMLIVCSRCLKEAVLEMRRRISVTYPVEKNQQVIDLDPDIRQDIILEYPMKPLCDQACKGLCPACGTNLNGGQCQCRKQ